MVANMPLNNNSKINVSYWNANSLLPKIHELYHYLVTNDIDICCVSETAFDENTIIPSHSQYRVLSLNRQADHVRASGGVAILVRRNLNCRALGSPRTRLLESVGLQISTTRGPIDFFSIYLPGGATRQEISEHYRNDLHLLTNRRSSFFIMGDFNSKHQSWNCNRANLAGNILFCNFQSE